MQFGGGSAKDNLLRLSRNMDGGLPPESPEPTESHSVSSSPPSSPRGSASSPKMDPRRFPATTVFHRQGSPKSHRAAKRHTSTSSIETDSGAGANTSMHTLTRQNAPQSKIWSGAVAVRSSVDFFNSSPLVQRTRSSSGSSSGSDDEGNSGGGALTVDGGVAAPFSVFALSSRSAAAEVPPHPTTKTSSNTSTPKAARRTFFKRGGGGKGKLGCGKDGGGSNGSPLLRRAVDLSGKQYGDYSDVIGGPRPNSPSLMRRAATVMTRAENWLSDQQEQR